jgi:molybdopterin converting factor subunit 1
MKILFFAQAAQLAGTREEQWEIPSPISPDQFWEELERRHSGTGSLRASCRLARNCEYLSQEGCLHPGDEVAIIPPVSGG